MADIRIEDHGSIVIMEPQTRNARVWCAEALAEAPTMGRNRYAVEARFVNRIIDGALNAGFTLSA